MPIRLDESTREALVPSPSTSAHQPILSSTYSSPQSLLIRNSGDPIYSNDSIRPYNVYNATTIPILRQSSSKNYSPILSDTSSVITTTTDGGGNEYSDNQLRSLESEGATATTGTAAGGYNELGIPRTSIHRWLPKAQRNLLQKHAELFAKPVPKTKKETDIF